MSQPFFALFKNVLGSPKLEYNKNGGEKNDNNLCS